MTVHLKSPESNFTSCCHKFANGIIRTTTDPRKVNCNEVDKTRTRR